MDFGEFPSRLAEFSHLCFQSNMRSVAEIGAALDCSIWLLDRREKSSSGTAAANLAEIEQRVQILSNQLRILNDQYMVQPAAIERRLQALNSQIQPLTHQYGSR
jgi:hypothetical protein